MFNLAGNDGFIVKVSKTQTLCGIKIKRERQLFDYEDTGRMMKRRRKGFTEEHVRDLKI